MGLWLAKPYLEIRGKQHGLKAKYEFLTRCGLRLFSFGASVDILDMMKEYLDICEECPALVNPKVIFQHLKNMVVRNDKVCVLLSFSAPFQEDVAYSRTPGLGTPDVKHSCTTPATV